METRINLSNVSHIEIHDISRGRELEWVPESYLFKLGNVKFFHIVEGHYYTFTLSGGPVPLKEGEEVFNGKVFTMPHINMKKGNFNIQTKYFTTYEKAKAYANHHFPHIKKMAV